ncbi:MAG: PRC-barrel domain protein [bacterium ADurb.Bin400]|nr:MAG: PRC-barrel domain protein [bacterium ADurb.Bin400]
MYRASELKNKPIITYDEGEVIYRVDDTVFDPKTHEIIAIVAESGTVLADAKVIPFARIKAIGPDAVTVKDKDAIIEVAKDSKIGQLMSKENVVMGKKIMTEDGKDLGEIDDILFRENDGKVDGFVVTGGLFADAYRGKPFLPISEISKVGGDVVFVPNDTVNLIEENKGGLKELWEKTKQRTESYAHEAKSATAEIGRKVQKTTSQYTKGDKGKDLENQAKDTWSKVKNTASELWGRAGSEVEERRVKAAVGRPVTRVIYDQDDNIILNTGDIITHEAIRRARKEGSLDVLLNSVYKDEPDLSKEEMRAKKDEYKRKR